MNDATVKFEIWDIAGQKGYRSLAPMYYRGAAMAIIAYDLTSIDSFARAKKWVLELQKQGNPNMVMALVENKADLEDGRSLMVKVFVPDVMACNTHVEKGDLVAVSIDVEEPGLDGGWTTRITRDEQLKRVEPSKGKKKL